MNLTGGGGNGDSVKKSSTWEEDIWKIEQNPPQGKWTLVKKSKTQHHIYEPPYQKPSL